MVVNRLCLCPGSVRGVRRCLRHASRLLGVALVLPNASPPASGRTGRLTRETLGDRHAGVSWTVTRNRNTQSGTNLIGPVPLCGGGRVFQASGTRVSWFFPIEACTFNERGLTTEARFAGLQSDQAFIQNADINHIPFDARPKAKVTQAAPKKPTSSTHESARTIAGLRLATAHADHRSSTSLDRRMDRRS